MDRNQKRIASGRSTERCPFCGQAIRWLSDRQRRLHDQTCRRTDAVTEVDVVQYPKVVEDLTTPAEWEAEVSAAPVFVVNDRLEIAQVPLFGELHRTWELQGIQGYEYSNDSAHLVTPAVSE
jgi:hypothetical protein